MKFNGEALKKMAVEVVSDYLHNHVPLSESIAEKAKTHSFNPEQIKRLIEISNQVAYLKLLEKSSDRTFEFPLADYQEVMSTLAKPEESADEEDMSKEASQKRNPWDIVTDRGTEELEKEASQQKPDPLEQDPGDFLKKASRSEKVRQVNKEYLKANQELEKLASQEHYMLTSLLDRGRELKDEDQFMDKVAFVSDGDEEMIQKVARLLYGEEVDPSYDELFYEADLDNAREFVGLFKEAEELIRKKHKTKASVEKAAEFLQKEAFSPAAAAQTAKNAVTSSAKKTGQNLGKASKKSLQTAEYGTALLDHHSKRNVWKSLRGE